MAFRIPTPLRELLWDHQRGALAAMSRYIAAFDIDHARAGLVHMPTGSGKTGIIACLSRGLVDAGPVLIVCPRVGLRDQLVRDVSVRFFRNAGFDPVGLPRRVVKVSDGSADLGDLSQLVLVMTVQMLASIRDEGRPLFRQLERDAALVLFDEGHYEPATTWSDAVRRLRCPRIVFTATPFRDDFKLFDVDPEHAFRFTLEEALRERYVRRVQFYERPPTRSPNTFAANLVTDYQTLFGNPQEARADRPRAIVRCDSQEEIRQLQQALRHRGRSAIGIHENFVDDPNIGEYHRVPDPATVDATFWVHQFKLLEGIDDPRFQLLALFSELKSVRSLVQQIGRVLRNPSRTAGATAHVLDHSVRHRQTDLWRSFEKFDSLVAAEDPAALGLNSSSLVEALQDALPGLLYVDGRFRTPAQVTELDFEALQLPLSAKVYRRPRAFSLRRVRDAIVEECSRADLFHHAPPVRPDSLVVFYVSAGSSRLLDRGYFPEPKLGACVVYARGDYVFIYENLHSLAAQAVEGDPVPLPRLKRLFGNRKGSRLTSVNILNANLGADQVRARTTAAVHVEELPPGFDEHSYVLNTATGYSAERKNGVDVKVRRYLGVGSGRISDFGGREVSFDDWKEWAQHVETILDGTGHPLPVFGRWAAETRTPASTAARNILLDLDDVIEQFKTVEDDDIAGDEPLEVSELCTDVAGGRFSVRANERAFDVEVNFDPERARYELRSRDLDRAFFSSDGEHKEGLVRYLNRTQSFRVIPATDGYLYTLGRFLRPLIEFGPDYDDAKMGVLSTLVSSRTLENVRSEKGAVSRPGGAGWEAGSLFDLIDNLAVGSDLAPHFAGAEVLVCDDMGDESADFLMVQPANGPRRKRVVFIHGKASATRSLCSASALQEVCGQAQKNLREVSLFADARRSRRDRWNRPWNGAPHTLGTVRRRIRRTPGGDVEELIQRTVKDPSADREVWLLLGNLLSKAELTAQLARTRPNGHAIQAAYLLMSTISSVAAAGARLTVFCS